MSICYVTYFCILFHEKHALVKLARLEAQNLVGVVDHYQKVQFFV